MLRERLAPLFAGFLATLLAGAGMRRPLARLAPPHVAAAVLTAVIVDVTAPALVLDVMLRARLSGALLVTLAPATASPLATMALALAAARALGLDRPATGTLCVCASFSNTGFIGLPLIQGLYPAEPAAAQAALIVDTFDTTALLWTLGVAVATRFGARSDAGGDGGRALLTRPLTWAVLAGLALNVAGVALPWWLRPAVVATGATTGPLVFLVLGLGADVSKLRGRALPLGAAVALKLVVAPALALAAAMALGMRGPAAWVAVLQSAMPPALVGVAIATQCGCDATLAAAAGLLGTLLAPLTLPAWIAAADALLR